MTMFKCNDDGTDPRLFVDAHGNAVYIEADEMGECIAAMYVSPDVADAIAAALAAAAKKVRAVRCVDPSPAASEG